VTEVAPPSPGALGAPTPDRCSETGLPRSAGEVNVVSSAGIGYDGVTVAYKGTVALRDFSLTVRPARSWR
jgi:hypothetical protein